MAPEVLFSPVGTPYTSKCDLFSIGVVYFYMLFGQLPFPSTTLKDLEKKIVNQSGNNLVFPPPIEISNLSKQLLSSLLQSDPIERLSWKRFFNHEIFYSPALNSFAPNIDAVP